MSETQKEYETEQETGAEPTPGPWKLQKDPESLEIEVIRDSEGYHAPWHIAKVYGEAPSVIDGTGPLEDCATEDNARLIAAAGTAAQEAREMGYDPQKAREMGYDPQKAVEALPKGLEQARCAIIDLLDGPPGETSAPAVKSAIKRLAFFLSAASNEEVSEIVDDKMLNDALDSAEGSENEQ